MKRIQSEPALFTAVLDFANMRELPVALSAKESKELRSALHWHKGAAERWPAGWFMNADRVRWRPDEPRAEQARLVDMLEVLVRRVPRETRMLADNLERTIARIPLEARPIFREEPPDSHARNVVFVPSRYDRVYPKFTLTSSALIRPRSLAQWYSMALAVLLALGGDVRRCRLPTCGRFFAVLRSKGPRKEYCSRSHGSQARVKRKRERDANERWKQ